MTVEQPRESGCIGCLRWAIALGLVGAIIFTLIMIFIQPIEWWYRENITARFVCADAAPSRMYWHPDRDYFITYVDGFGLYFEVAYACTSNKKSLAYLGAVSSGKHDDFYAWNNPYIFTRFHRIFDLYNLTLSEFYESAYRSDSVTQDMIVANVAVNSDGTLAVFALREVGGEYSILLWDMEQNSLVDRYPYQDIITSLNFNADGTLLGINNSEWWGVPDL